MARDQRLRRFSLKRGATEFPPTYILSAIMMTLTWKTPSEYGVYSATHLWTTWEQLHELEVVD